MSYVSSIYHIVISTHQRELTIVEEHKKELYSYIWGIIKHNNCTLVRINGMPDHIHILLELNPMACLSLLVRDIKRSSSYWLGKNNLMPNFKGWSKEYAAFSCSFEHKERARHYIMCQESHHQNETSDSEYKRLIESNGLSQYEG